LPVQCVEFLYEVCTTSGESVEDEALLLPLKSMKGKGKGAKLADLLSKMPSASKNSVHRRAVAAQILSARLERAERWQRWTLAQSAGEIVPASAS
jgi:hypothetical protein